MLILLVRFGFVLLLTLAGVSNGQLLYRPLFEGTMPWWFGAAMGFGVGVTLIAAEQAFRRRFTRSLVGFLIGLAGGLILSFLVLLVLRVALDDSPTLRALDLPLTMVITYLVMVTVLRNADRFRVVVPFVEFRAEQQRGGGTLVIDGELLPDGRLTALAAADLLGDRFLIHRTVLAAWEAAAIGGDPVKQARARRALEVLAELRALPGLLIEIDETEIPTPRDADDLLIRLTRLENGRLLTARRDLAHRAVAEGVLVVDLAALGAAFAPSVRVGELLTVLIEKPGEGKGQGIGFLPDGSMVVVGNAGDRLGQNVAATVMRMHHTANGRMVFAEFK